MVRFRFVALAVIGGLVSACGVDSYLTCGAPCEDAANDTTVGSDVGVPESGADVQQQKDAAIGDGTISDGTINDGTVGGLDANCHAQDSSAPQWACPQSGCCPFSGNGYACNSQGLCCRTNGGSCQSGNSCCSGACAQGSGGNASCAAQCSGSGVSCSQSSDCCVDFWCGSGNKCTTCTGHNQPCTSNYECCNGDQCQVDRRRRQDLPEQLNSRGSSG